MIPSYEDLIGLMTKRRSIRYFSEKPLEKERLMEILAAGRIAPSVENLQPWHFHVILSDDLKNKMMEASCYGNFTAGAAAFVVISCDRSTSANMQTTIWNPHELEYSCVTAGYSMMLAATALNVGSCWVSLHHGPAHNILKLKDHQVVVGGLMLGHMKKSDEEPTIEHQREPMEKMYTIYE